MASKRPPIEIADISQNLRESKGQGINAFFSSPQQAPTPAVTKQTRTPAPRYPGTPVPENHSTAVPRREIKRRHPFDVYRDQLRILKDFSLEEKRTGGIGSESAMVREAIDAYIENRRKK
jgi:hypothetical protein